jgi:hypothetical protein
MSEKLLSVGEMLSNFYYRERKLLDFILRFLAIA